MRISDLVKMGLKNLSRRKARTALTVIGVIIGTISIVVMISIGIGMNTSFTKQVMELGSLTTITVDQYAAVTDDKGEYVDSYKQKMDDTLVASIQQMEHVKAITPIYNSGINLYSKGYETSAQLYVMDFHSMEDFEFPKLTFGKYPKEEHPTTIIFGSDTLTNFQNPQNYNVPPVAIDPSKDKLFFCIQDWNYELNMEVPQKRFYVEDLAVMEKTESFEGYDWNVYMDRSVFQRYYAEFVKNLKKVDQGKAMKALKEYGQIRISVDNVKNVKKVQDEIKKLGFQSTSLSSTLEPMQKTSNMLQMVLGGVGAVSMLVSAISIANTMVMSIYERTKEIGVMKVLGCIITDIKKLFLFEAGMIGLMGGIIGIVFSYMISLCINHFGGPLFEVIMASGAISGEKTKTSFSIIPLWLPFAAALFTITIGIISGYYPARRATKISAIEAMKSE